MDFKISTSFFMSLFLGLVLASPSLGVAGRVYQSFPQKTETSQEWNGEFLKPTEGLFYLNILLDQFKNHSEAKYQQLSVQFSLFHLEQKTTHTFSQSASSKESTTEPTIWKIPEGQYVLTKILMVDSYGQKRSWQPIKRSRSFTINRTSISNLGRWRLKPFGQYKLSVSMKMFQTQLTNLNDMKMDQITKVINGYNGSTQKVFQPSVSSINQRKIDEKKLSKSYTIRRTISMYFKVDLFRHNRYAKKVAGIISAHDPQFRKCYTDVLEFDERVKGQVKFQFGFSKTTRSIEDVNIIYENVRDRNLTNCLNGHLQNIRLPISESLNGELTYTFDSY